MTAANTYAMDRQIQNQRKFKEKMIKEEEKILSQIAKRKSAEAADRALAEKLQAEYMSHAADASMMNLVAVVPNGAKGGDLIEAILQGGTKVRVMVPASHAEGDLFRFSCPRPQGCKQALYEVDVPEELDATGAFSCYLPNGDLVTAVAPPGAAPGTRIGVPYDPAPLTVSMPTLSRHASELSSSLPVPNSGAAPNPPYAENLQRSDTSTSDREEFLAALPDDIRAELLRDEEHRQNREREHQHTQNTIHVTVPSNLYPGSLFAVQLPSGRMVHVRVPRGVGPGDRVAIRVPATDFSAGAAAPPAREANTNIYRPPVVEEREPTDAQKEKIRVAQGLLDQNLITRAEFDHARREIMESTV